MLLGPLCSDVLRVMSVPVAMFSGSVGPDFRGAGALAAGSGWAEGGSDVAVPGAGEGGSRRAEACDGLRESIVGMGVGFGAGRV